MSRGMKSVLFIVGVLVACFLLRNYGRPTVVSHVHPIDSRIPAIPVDPALKKSVDDFIGPQIKVPMPEPGSASKGKSFVDMSILDGINPLYYVVGAIVVVLFFVLRSARSGR